MTVAVRARFDGKVFVPREEDRGQNHENFR